MASRNRQFAVVTLPICAAILLVGAWFAGAGNLIPPVGPVTGTMKTLVEVEPRIIINATNAPPGTNSVHKIIVPGSYYLTGNILGVSGKYGIEIAASCVTIDLMGFELAGAPGSLDGIASTAAGFRNIEIRNGCVTNWGQDGIDIGTTLGSINATNCIIDDIRASNNGARGIGTGNCSAVNRCVAASNAGDGISTGRGGTVTDCSASQNTGTGIQAESGCTVTNCSVNNNGDDGIGINTACTVTNCSAMNNSGFGIATTADGGGNTILHCTVDLNNLGGISVTSNCTVADCTAAYNTGDGIVCASGCLIRSNTCSENGRNGDGAGIHATAAANRIEGNNCTAADRGIDVDAAGNIIVRNTCSGNTTNNWDIFAGNACLVESATTSGAILGVSGGVAPGSTDPNANFSY